MKRGKGYGGGDSDDDYLAEDAGGGGRSSGSGRQARRTMVTQTPRSAGRSRPTNNQLLYKAYFRWNHYGHKLRNGTAHLPTETDACPSVTAAFLQVLHTLNLAEGYRASDQRNILQILSNNTRRTKVVELSTGTHRVPDELRKHYLSDGEGGQYSTNLDRNRYGNDDQYLFTVIRYDLEYLGLCPCMVDVEIIDAKNDNQSIFVSAGQEACICTKLPGLLQDPTYAMQHFASRSRGALPPVVGLAPPDAMPGTSRDISPKRSGSQASLAFDALVMAATGGTEGAAAAAAGGEAPVESRLGGPLAGLAAAGSLGAAAAAAVAAAAAAGRGAAAAHNLPSRQRSRLWSALSYGDVDSLQNALDAFRAEDEIASGPGLSDALAGAVGGGPTSSESFRKRQRKPMRGPSSSAIQIPQQQMDLLAAASGMDPALLSSLVIKSQGLASGLREHSGDNAAAAGDVVSSGAAPSADGGPRRTSSAGRSTGSQGRRASGARSGGAAPGDAAAAAAAGALGVLAGLKAPDGEQLSQEDDSEPVTGSRSRSGGRKSGGSGGRGGGGGAGAGEGADAADGLPADGGADADVLPDGGAMDADGDGADDGDGGDGDEAFDGYAGAGAAGPPMPRRVRHVPRQSSAVNLATRVGPAEMKRMAAEVELLRAENRLLRQAATGSGLGDEQLAVLAAAAAVSGGGGAAAAAEAGAEARLAALEQEVALLRQQLSEQSRARRVAEDKVLQLNQELIQTRNTANQVLHHALMKEGGSIGVGPLAAQLQGLVADPGSHPAAAAAMAAAAMAAAAAAAACVPAAAAAKRSSSYDQQPADLDQGGGAGEGDELQRRRQQQQQQQEQRQPNGSHHEQQQQQPQSPGDAAALQQAAAADGGGPGRPSLAAVKVDEAAAQRSGSGTTPSDDCKAFADREPAPAAFAERKGAPPAPAGAEGAGAGKDPTAAPAPLVQLANGVAAEALANGGRMPAAPPAVAADAAPDSDGGDKLAAAAALLPLPVETA